MTQRNKVKIYFRKVDAASRKKRESVERSSSSAQPRVVERTVESLWYDRTPPDWYFIEWHRAWNQGFPSEENVELYNSMHPIEEHIVLVEEDK